MKKIISAALAVILMLGTLFLASCGKDEPTTQAANGTQKATASTAAPTEATVDPAPATTVPTTAPTTAKATKKPTKKQSATKAKSTKKVNPTKKPNQTAASQKPPKITRNPNDIPDNINYMGVIKKRIYKNEFIDITFDPTNSNANWVYFAGDILASASECDESVYKNKTNFKNYLDQGHRLMDLSVHNTDVGSGIMICIEKTDGTVSAEEYMHIVQNERNEHRKMHHEATYSFGKIKDTTLAGYAYKQCDASADGDYIRLFTRKINDYVVYIHIFGRSLEAINRNEGRLS